MRYVSFFDVLLRPSEMEAYNDGFNVWNAKWGFSNKGNPSADVNSNTGAIIVPVAAFYRITGMIVGQSGTTAQASAYLNLPRDELNGQDPSYPNFSVGCAQAVAPVQFTMGFSGVIQLTGSQKFSIYLANTFSPKDPYCRLFFEQIQY